MEGELSTSNPPSRKTAAASFHDFLISSLKESSALAIPPHSSGTATTQDPRTPTRPQLRPRAPSVLVPLGRREQCTRCVFLENDFLMEDGLPLMSVGTRLHCDGTLNVLTQASVFKVCNGEKGNKQTNKQNPNLISFSCHWKNPPAAVCAHLTSPGLPKFNRPRRC